MKLIIIGVSSQEVLSKLEAEFILELLLEVIKLTDSKHLFSFKALTSK